MGKSRLFRFGEFEVDDAAWQLRRQGTPIPLQTKPFRLLLHLLEHRERIVSKEELLAAVWGDVCMSDAALATALKELRQALGDAGRAQLRVRTLRGAGYRFVGGVEELAARPKRSARGGICGVPRGLSMYFAGRGAELAELESLLTETTHAGARACVEGLPGVGKTELALHLVHKLAHEAKVPGGIFWLDAEPSDLRPLWGGPIADRLALAPGPVHERCEEALRIVTGQSEPTLIVLDRVSSWSATHPAPLPEGAHIRILVTTRERALGGPRFVHVELGFLEAPHDRELVEGVAGRTLGPALDGLLEYLGGHALGLELAGAFLATYPSESPESYLELLRDGSQDPEQERERDRRAAGPSPGGAARDVGTDGRHRTGHGAAPAR